MNESYRFKGNIDLLKAEMEYSSKIIYSNTFFGENHFNGAFTREKIVILLNMNLNK